MCCGWRFLHICCSDIFRLACFGKHFTPRCSREAGETQLEGHSRPGGAGSKRAVGGWAACVTLHAPLRLGPSRCCPGLISPRSLPQPPRGSYSPKETGKVRKRWHAAWQCQAGASLPAGRRDKSGPELRDARPGTASSAHGGRWPPARIVSRPRRGAESKHHYYYYKSLLCYYYCYCYCYPPTNQPTKTQQRPGMFCYASLSLHVASFSYHFLARAFKFCHNIF